MTKRALIAAMAAALAAPLTLSIPMTAAMAHGIWLAPRAGELTVVYGVGPQDEAYQPDKVKTAEGRSVPGEARAVEIARRAHNAVLTAGDDVAVIVTTMDNGFWTKGDDGKWHNKPKSQVPRAASGMRSIKINTHVLKGGADATKARNAALEIVPLVDPTTLKAGDDLPVQVLADGKPVAGAAIHPDYVNDANSKTDRTDAQGKATIPVRNNGLNVIGVSHATPIENSADADKLSIFATLSYTTPFKED